MKRTKKRGRKGVETGRRSTDPRKIQRSGRGKQKNTGGGGKGQEEH